MKVTSKIIAMGVLLLGSSAAFSQLTVEDNNNERTNGLYDRQESLTYHFPQSTDFTLQKEKEVFLQGSGAKAHLGNLSPGTYCMLYTRKDGKMVRDFFEVEKR